MMLNREKVGSWKDLLRKYGEVHLAARRGN